MTPQEREGRVEALRLAIEQLLDLAFAEQKDVRVVIVETESELSTHPFFAMSETDEGDAIEPRWEVFQSYGGETRYAAMKTLFDRTVGWYKRHQRELDRTLAGVARRLKVRL